jgi:hypothetical protein
MDKRTHFLQIPNVFFETCGLPESSQILFLRLAAHLGKSHQGVFIGSIRQLATLVRMSKSTVDRMMYVLIDAELIIVTLSEGMESKREVMSIEIEMDRLWDLNVYHCTVASVPIWDTILPDCPKLGQIVPDLDTTSQNEALLSQFEASVSQAHAQTQDKTLNTDKTPLIQKKEESPAAQSESVSPFSQEEIEFLSWLKEKKIPWKENDVEANKRHITFVRDRISTKETLHRYCDHVCMRFTNTVWLANLAKQWLLDEFLRTEQTRQPQSPTPIEIPSQDDIEALAAQILQEYPEIVLVYQESEYGPYLEMPVCDDNSQFADGVRDAEDWRILRSDRRRLAQVLEYSRRSVSNPVL